jgi:hypothetical protein
MTLKQKQENFVSIVQKQYGINRDYITRQEVIWLIKNIGIKSPTWLVNDLQYKIARGKYKLPNLLLGQTAPQSSDDEDLTTVAEEIFNPKPKKEVKRIFPKHISYVPSEGLVPGAEPTFVPFGCFQDVKSIIESGVFLPIYISGPTRSGKTLTPIQVCSQLKKNLYRVNITIETDESDLLGGYKLINGETVWEDGPAVKAIEDPTGAVLLLDEIDLGSNKLLCLQPILEGNGIYIKKTNRWVRPSEGFNVIATANTKGRGSEDGRYIGTNVMNEAMLERFPITYDQGYANKKIEASILKKNLKMYGEESPQFIDCLCQWADNIRKTNANGGVDETISTGRLVYIIKTYVVFGRNRMKAIKDNIARFDLNTQTSFLDMYTKIDEHAVDGPDDQIVLGVDLQTPVVKKVCW